MLFQDEEDEERITVRGKWIFSGSDSIEEMVDRLEERAEQLRELDEEGYVISSGGDDYWTLVKDPNYGER